MITRREYLVATCTSLSAIAGCTGNESLETSNPETREPTENEMSTNTPTETLTEETTTTPEPEGEYFDRTVSSIINETHWLVNQSTDARQELKDIIAEQQNQIDSIRSNIDDVSDSDFDLIEGTRVEINKKIDDIGTHFTGEWDYFDDSRNARSDQMQNYLNKLMEDLELYAEVGDSENLKVALDDYEKTFPRVNFSESPSGLSFEVMEGMIMDGPDTYGYALPFHMIAGKGGDTRSSVIFHPPTDSLLSPKKYSANRFPKEEISSFLGGLIDSGTSPDDELFWRSYDGDYQTHGGLFVYTSEDGAKKSFDGILNDVISKGETQEIGGAKLSIGPVQKLVTDNNGSSTYFYGKQEGGIILFFGMSSQPWDEKREPTGWVLGSDE